MSDGYVACNSDYPPICMIILYAVSSFAIWMNADLLLTLKGSLFIFLMLTSMVFYLWTRDLMITSVLMLSLLLSSMAQAFLDIYFAPTLLLALWALKNKKTSLFSFLYTISCLIKWQPIILAPFLLIFLFDISSFKDLKTITRKKLFQCIVPVIIVLIPIAGVFGFETLRSFYKATHHTMISGSAMNFNWLLTYALHVLYPEVYGPLQNGYAMVIMKSDSFFVNYLPKILFYACYIICFFKFVRLEKTFMRLLVFSITGFLSYYIFNTGVHENHLFVVSLLAVVLYWIHKDCLAISSFLVLLNNINLLVIYGIEGRGFPIHRVVGIDITIFISLVSVLFFVFLFYRLYSFQKNNEM